METFKDYIQRQYDAIKGKPCVDFVTKEDFYYMVMKKVPKHLHVTYPWFLRYFHGASPNAMLEEIIRKKLGE